MKYTSKISLVIALLFSAVFAFGQCETYLQKANAAFAQKQYEDAKRQYMNYKECKPNASGIDAKIAECDRQLLTQKEDESKKSAADTQSDKTSVSPNQTVDNNNTPTVEQQPPKRTQTYIGIGDFSGHKSKEYENIITSNFTHDRRFAVKKLKSSFGRTQTQDDVDYIITATSNVKQQNTPYYNGGYLGNVYRTSATPEMVEITLTITDAKTGQILVNQTEDHKSISSFIGKIWQQKCKDGIYEVISLNKKELEISLLNGDKIFQRQEPPLPPHTAEVIGYCKVSEKEKLNVYELQTVNDTPRKSKIGEVKVTGFNGSYILCKITENAKEVAAKYNSGANLIVQK